MNKIELGDGFSLLESIDVANLILTDIPYLETRNRWDVGFDYDRFVELSKRVCGEFGTMITFANIEMASKLIQLAPKWFKYEIIWIKNKPTGFLNSKRKVLDNHELILIFTKSIGKYTYNPQKTQGHRPVNNWNKQVSDGTNYNKTKIGIVGGGNTDRYPTSTIYFAKEANIHDEKFHPTQKPLGLIQLLMKQYSNEEDLVIDPFAGSFVVDMAARLLNRRSICRDVCDEYYLKYKQTYNV